VSKRVAVHTLGCKVNQYDSEAILAQFKAHGYEVVDFDTATADVYVINTCTVTNISDHKSRQMIRKAHRQNPEAKIVVVGCLAQTDPDQVRTIPGVNLVIGTNERNRIVALVESLSKDEQNTLIEDIFQVREFEELNAVSFEGRTRAYLKIQDGCNQFCSYCKVPFARGPSRSRSEDSVIEQVKALISQGYREIVLTGVHLGAYGRDLVPPSSLAQIVQRITTVPGIERIRISSIDPNEIDDGLIDLVANNAHVCRHLHIPLQSGCDAVLEKMRRRYRTADFRSVVHTLRERVPQIAITTDVIVGFPGETPEMFEQTYAFLAEMGLSKIHVFKYSPRAGTAAAQFPDQVTNQEKERRSRALIQLSNQMAAAFHERFLDQVLPVLVETHLEGQLTGHTDNYIHVQASSEGLDVTQDLTGQIVPIRILSVNHQGAAGILIQE